MISAPENSGENRLAIVIPAFRSRHLPQALESLRGQTDRRFRLYIGDDASPQELYNIIQEHTEGLEVVYHRFEQNLGGKDLVAQWHRCIALTRDEPWIWLFSDDDIAGPECVAAFHRQIDDGVGAAALLRFNHQVIDDQGRIIERPLPHPPQETDEALIEAMLTLHNLRHWRAPDHIFSRTAYASEGGFITFPRALYSDWATWILFAREGGIRTLAGTGLQWRKHPEGVSSGRLGSDPYVSTQALLGFLQWLDHYIVKYHPGRRPRLLKRSREYYLGKIRYLNPPMEWKDISIYSKQAVSLWGNRWKCAFWLAWYIIRSQARTWPGIHQIAARRARMSEPA